MIAATVTLTTAGQSLRTLLNAVVANMAPVGSWNGRACEIQIQWGSGAAFYLVYKSGAVTVATDSGFQFADADGQRLLVLRPGMSNVLSIDDLYLAGGAGAETARILVITQ